MDYSEVAPIVFLGLLFILPIVFALLTTRKTIHKPKTRVVEEERKREKVTENASSQSKINFKPPNLKKTFAKFIVFLNKHPKSRRILSKLFVLVSAGIPLVLLGWLGFNALLVLSDINCDVSCGTDVSGGNYFFGSSLTPDIDCDTNCDTFCTSGFSFGGYQSAPDCDTYCNTFCESSSIDASDIDVDVDCDTSCRLHPPRIDLETIKILFSSEYLKVILNRSFGLQL